MSGNIQPQSYQLAEPLWTDPCIKCGISAHKLISTQKKESKKAQVGIERMRQLSPKIKDTITLHNLISRKPVF